MFPIYLFESKEALPGFFDSFFHGLFLVKGTPIFFQIGALLSLFVCCYSAFIGSQRRVKWASKSVCISSFFCLSLISFVLFQPWDELFILVRHSLNFAEVGNFSFNRLHNQEGVVDFLPLLILGILSKAGLPLLETHFLICVLGGWLCILAGRRTLVLLNFKNAEFWGYPLLLIYPPLLLNSANGFFVPLFSAVLLWAINLLFFEHRSQMGLIVLSLLPLIRLEAVWFCILSLCFLAAQKPTPAKKKYFIEYSLVFFPLVILSIWRWTHFGTPIPTPITYKSALGNSFYFIMGLRNFFMDFIAGGGLICFWILLITKKHLQKKALPILFSLFLFVIPYYFSGGDWFPPAWQRYLFPFTLALYIFCIAHVHLLWREGEQFKMSVWGPLILVVFGTLSLSFNSGSRFIEYFFTSKSSLAALRNRKVGKGNSRIQQLSQLGNHLQKTTDPAQTVASSELATLMFFSEREGLDLLGVTNPEIAHSPLRPSPKLFEKVKPQNELPYLIFKRLKPELIGKYQPEIVYTFDFLVSDLIEEVPFEEITQADLLKAFLRWNKWFERLNAELFGGVNRLLEAGYSPVLVRYSNLCSLYFVSKAAKENHFKRLEEHGMTKSIITNNRL